MVRSGPRTVVNHLKGCVIVALRSGALAIDINRFTHQLIEISTTDVECDVASAGVCSRNCQKTGHRRWIDRRARLAISGPANIKSAGGCRRKRTCYSERKILPTQWSSARK